MKKHLLILIPNLGKGGAQRVFHQQIKVLSRYFTVTGVVFNRDGFLPGDHEQGIVSLDVPAGASYIGKARFFLTRITRLRRLKKKLNASLCISHLEGADYVNILSGTSMTICWIHGSKLYDENISGVLGFLRHRFLMPWLYRRCDHLATVSHAIAIEIQHYIGQTNNITTLYNTFDVDKIVAESNEPIDPAYESLFNMNNLIVTHCRLSAQKNLPALLALASHLKDTVSFKLIIIGDGELRNELLNSCRKLNLNVWDVWQRAELSNNFDVYFLGHQPNPLKYVRRAKLFIMTSLWEGFPLALCEAVILRVPVICSDCPTGPREILLPALSLDQKLEHPAMVSLGALMPLVRTDDMKSILTWSSVIKDMLSLNTPPDEAARAMLLNEISMDKNEKNVVDLVNKVLISKATQ